MSNTKPFRRLPLAGAHNVRDLGGYACPGGLTRWGAFLRSDGTNNLTDGDIAFLARYRLTDVIDLRTEFECESWPSRFHAASDVAVHNVSMSDEMHALNFEFELDGTISDMYIGLLDHKKAEMARIFRILGAAQGCALFHCSAGKDRTGVVAMLLLHLAGVGPTDIVTDYAQSEIHLRNVLFGRPDGDRRNQIPQYMLRSMPESAYETLQHLEKEYGNAEKYLLKAGLSPAEVDAVRTKMVDREA